MNRNTDLTLSPHKIITANVLANNCLAFTHSAEAKHSIHFESCFWVPDNLSLMALYILLCFGLKESSYILFTEMKIDFFKFFTSELLTLPVCHCHLFGSWAASIWWFSVSDETD